MECVQTVVVYSIGDILRKHPSLYDVLVLGNDDQRQESLRPFESHRVESLIRYRHVKV